MRPAPLPVAALALGVLAGTMLTPAAAARAETLPGPTSRTVTDGTTTFTVVTNPVGGATLSYIDGGPVKLLTVTTTTATR